MKLLVVVLVAFLALAQVQGEGCIKDKCKIENNCRCSNDSTPFPDGSGPQLIVLTFDEAIVKEVYKKYWKPLLLSRTNPDGKPIGATFYVPHEYTDYTFVNEIWLNGFEIGVHSISKNNNQEYWRHSKKQVLIDEFKGQRQILHNFADIPLEHIKGVRSPQLQLNGDVTFEAYKEADLTYDNSMPSLPDAPLFPYTLDYESEQECLATIDCPKQSHPGSWVLPISDLNGKLAECHSLATCNITGSAEFISNWLFNEIDKVRNGTRQPITLIVESYWFEFTKNSYDAFSQFLDRVANEKDIFFVSASQVRNWIMNPVPLEKFKTEFDDNRTSDCDPQTCILKRQDNNKIYNMGSCIKCPEVYPWVGNPDGKK